ncbi:VOC family protein [Microbacterium sp. MM2322]|uniref:VOC family protein n=1 Tax=Microbacterium sp. MM2322 TaxID=3157631 RepID=UPI0032D5A5F7
MPLFDHIGISVRDLSRSTAQFDPVMRLLGCTREDAVGSVSWYRGEEELILYPARDEQDEPHRTGRVGWQHLAFAVDSREDVDRLHDAAIAAGWSAIREPKPYPRFSDRYYASFVEDDNGVRLEFMFNPPRHAADG